MSHVHKKARAWDELTRKVEALDDENLNEFDNPENVRRKKLEDLIDVSLFDYTGNQRVRKFSRPLKHKKR